MILDFLTSFLKYIMEVENKVKKLTQMIDQKSRKPRVPKWKKKKSAWHGIRSNKIKAEDRAELKEHLRRFV